MIRDNTSLSVKRSKVVVGDIINIIPGMEIPADSIAITATHLIIDESLITESNESVKKAVLAECLQKRDKHKTELDIDFDLLKLPTPILFSGSKVLSGEGKILAVSVGKSTILHEKKKESRDDGFQKETPLQKKLKNLENTLAKIALQTSLVITLVLLMRFIIERSQVPSWDNEKHWNQLFNIFLIGVFFFNAKLNKMLNLLKRSQFLWWEFRKDCLYQLF